MYKRVKPADAELLPAQQSAKKMYDIIRAHAETIRTRVVLLRNMPLANKTGITDEERALLGRWLAQGASQGP